MRDVTERANKATEEDGCSKLAGWLREVFHQVDFLTWRLKLEKQGQIHIQSLVLLNILWRSTCDITWLYLLRHMVSFLPRRQTAEHQRSRTAQPEGFWDALFAHTGPSRRVCVKMSASNRTRSGQVMCCADWLETAAWVGSGSLQTEAARIFLKALARTELYVHVVIAQIWGLTCVLPPQWECCTPLISLFPTTPICRASVSQGYRRKMAVKHGRLWKRGPFPLPHDCINIIF